MGRYDGSTWFDDADTPHVRLHAQLTPRAVAARLDAGVPLLLEVEQTRVPHDVARRIVAAIFTEQDIRRNRRRAARGQTIAHGWIVELWQAGDGGEVMLALESGSPRDADLLYDPFGRRHLKDEPVFDG